MLLLLPVSCETGKNKSIGGILKGMNYKALMPSQHKHNEKENTSYDTSTNDTVSTIPENIPLVAAAAKKSSPSSSSILPPPGSLQLRPRVISLNIMVAGLAGLGKTTTCSALLDSWLHPKSKISSSNRTRTRSTKVIDASRLFERFDPAANTLLRVRIIDTPGFGNQVNHRHSVRPICDYIATCREQKYHREMSSTGTEEYRDPTEEELVHVCLYFLSPGRFLEMDKHFLKKVQRQVTIVPVIAKADTLTDEEIASYRAELREILERERIEVYDFDGLDAAVSGASGSGLSAGLGVGFGLGMGLDGKAFHRGRKPGETLTIISRDGNYPWGKSRAFDPDHSDLTLIRDLLLSQHTERFLSVAMGHYATYRSRRIVKRKIGEGLKIALLAGLIVAQVTGYELKSLLPVVDSDSKGMIVLQSILDWGRKAGRNGLYSLGSIFPPGKGNSAGAGVEKVATVVDTTVVDAMPTLNNSSTSSSPSDGIWNSFQKLFSS